MRAGRGSVCYGIGWNVFGVQGPKGKIGDGRARGALRAGLLLALAMLALAGPVLLFGADTRTNDAGERAFTTSEASDAIKYHIPVIETVAAEWPSVDIVNYRSATSPGYHLALAAATKIGFGEPGLRWINLLAGCAFAGLVGAFAGAAAGGMRGALLALTLVASPYVLSSSCWITTDNAALAFVALAVGCAAFGSGSARASALGGVGATLAVAVRQLHIWPIAPLSLSMKAGSGMLARFPVIRTIAAGLGLEPPKRELDRTRFVVGALAVLAPVALLAFFVWKWQGLMPPMYRDKHASGVSWSMPALSLSLAAVFGGALLAHAWEGVRSLRLRDPWLWAAIALGLFLALAPQTAWNDLGGRKFGWMWEIAKRTPAIADRSLLFVVLAPIGSVILLAHWRAAAARDAKRAATILLFAGVCWCAAQMMNAQAWQRYAEPPVLAGVIWLAANASPASGVRARWPGFVRTACLAGPITLGAWLFTVCAVTIYARVF
ncbi:MAG: hypothetical protein ACTS27_07445 [Phycisphaerales bacterium]